MRAGQPDDRRLRPGDTLTGNSPNPTGGVAFYREGNEALHFDTRRAIGYGRWHAAGDTVITPLDLLPILVLAGGVWYWMDSLKTREWALLAAGGACARYGFQFLDETVMTERVRIARDGNGRLCLRRVYRFEFSDTGNNRRPGSVVMLGRVVEMVQLAGVLEAVK